MATECVAAEQKDIHRKHERANTHTEVVCTICARVEEPAEGIPRKQEDELDRDIESVTMHILKQEWKLLLNALVVAAKLRFTDTTTHRVTPECLVVRAAVVVTGESKESWKR